jgi:hypothetical protein
VFWILKVPVVVGGAVPLVVSDAVRMYVPGVVMWQENVATPLTAAFLSVAAPGQVRVPVPVLTASFTIVVFVVITIVLAFSIEAVTVNVVPATVVGGVVTTSFETVVEPTVKAVEVADVSAPLVAVSW